MAALPSPSSFDGYLTVLTAYNLPHSLFEAYPVVSLTLFPPAGQVTSQFSTTRTKGHGKSSPFWAEEFFASDIHPDTKLFVQVKKGSAVIGETEYVLTEEVLLSGPLHLRLQLETLPSEQSSSSLSLGKLTQALSISSDPPLVVIHLMTWRDLSALSFLPAGAPPSVPYIIHTSTFFGFLSRTHSQDGAASWPCFSFELSHIDSVFGSERQPWNRNYDAAQRIFGSGPQSEIVRMGAHSQHLALYRSRNTDIKGEVKSGIDFLKLLHFGVRRGKTRYFTYVIVGNSFRFSETGAPLGKDMLSKHAMHCDLAEEVVFAGEFVIVKDEKKGVFVFTIDNNSGTYSPSKLALGKLKELFVRNFPDLVVDAISFDDPKLKANKEWVQENARLRHKIDWKDS